MGKKFSTNNYIDEYREYREYHEFIEETEIAMCFVLVDDVLNSYAEVVSVRDIETMLNNILINRPIFHIEKIFVWGKLERENYRLAQQKDYLLVKTKINKDFNIDKPGIYTVKNQGVVFYQHPTSLKIRTALVIPEKCVRLCQIKNLEKLLQLFDIILIIPFPNVSIIVA